VLGQKECSRNGSEDCETLTPITDKLSLDQSANQAFSSIKLTLSKCMVGKMFDDINQSQRPWIEYCQILRYRTKLLGVS
jgi:hypothetical protein